MAQAYGRLRKLEEDYAGVQGSCPSDMREMAREDAVGLEADIEGLDAEIQRLLIPKDPNDSKTSSSRSGPAGEDEAPLRLGSVAYVHRHAEQRGWSVEHGPLRVPREGSARSPRWSAARMSTARSSLNPAPTACSACR